MFGKEQFAMNLIRFRDCVEDKEFEEIQIIKTDEI